MLRARDLALLALLTSELFACGSSEENSAGSGGTGAGGSGGGASGVELALGEVPASLTVRDGDVFWTDVRFDGTARFAVVNRVPKQGGAVTSVAELAGGVGFYGIAAGPAELAWVGFDAQAGGGSVFRAPSAGLDPSVLAPNQGAPVAIATGGSTLFWVNLSPGAVMSAAGSGAPVELATDGQDSSSCIAVFGSNVVWLSHQGGSRISRVAASGGASSVLVEGEVGGAINCLTADEQHVYFTRYGTSTGDFEPKYNHDGSVFKVGLGGGAPQELAKGFEAPHGITVRGDFVYFASSGDGSLHRVPKAGGTVTTVVAATGATDSFRTQSVVADSDGVYFISGRKIWAVLAP